MDTRNTLAPAPLVGLILAGGGARAAYQVGVLRAVAELLPPGTANPFRVICGTSAGAINAAALAVYARRFRQGVRRLELVWNTLRVEHIFRADARSVFGNAARFVASGIFGGRARFEEIALLDRSPLKRLLERYLPLDKIQASIDAGALHALSITASSYSSGRSITFCQGAPGIRGWERSRRTGLVTAIRAEHLMASSAIPFVFPAVRVGDEYFGDGSMRQLAPISPALHLGASRVFVIGVRRNNHERREPASPPRYPTLAQIAGHILDSIFLDGLDGDLERLRRINKTLSFVPGHYLRDADVELRPVETLLIAPSQDLAQLAHRHQQRLPRALRFFLSGIGALRREGSELVSYILFEQEYCRELMALGYADTLARRDEVLAFFKTNPVVTAHSE